MHSRVLTALLRTSICGLLVIAVGLVAAQTRDRDRREAQSKVLRAIDRDDGGEVRNLFAGDSGDLLKPDDDLGGGLGYLHAAARKCRPNAIAALLQVGAKVSFRPRGSQQSVLALAANRCVTEPQSIAEATMDALIRAGANPNAMYLGSNTRKPEPEFFGFASQCTSDGASIPSYLYVLDKWIAAGLDPGVKADKEAGGVTILHYWAGLARTSLCLSAIERLVRVAQPQVFSIADGKGRLPVDYTLGPAVFTYRDRNYLIYCFAYSDPRSEVGMRQTLNGLRVAYIARGTRQPDVNRACIGESEDLVRTKVRQGTDADGKVFLIQELRLDRITEPATTHNPDCSSPPGGWPRCQLLRLESVGGAFSLAAQPQVQTWFKEDDGTCPNSFDPATHKSPSDAGYQRCAGDCGMGWARIQFHQDGLSASGDYYTFVERMAKNWSHRLSRCYALTAYTGPAK